jgi:cold shock CspA family protein
MEDQIELHIGAPPVRLVCRVMYFHEDYGYGMTWSHAIDEDILLHHSAWSETRLGAPRDLENGDIVECDVERRVRGLFVVRVHRVERVRPRSVGKS